MQEKLGVKVFDSIMILSEPSLTILESALSAGIPM